MATPPRRRPETTEFTTPPGLDLNLFLINDHLVKKVPGKSRAKTNKIISKHNMIDLFGQDVVLIPINKNTFIQGTPEADEDSAEEDPDHHDQVDVENTESVAASSERAVSYDGHPCMKLGYRWCPKRSTPHSKP